MLKVKLQYFGHLMQWADSLEKTLILGKIGGKRRREQQRMRWLDGITDSKDMDWSKLWEIVEDREAWQTTVPGVTKSQIWLGNWTAATNNLRCIHIISTISLFNLCNTLIPLFLSFPSIAFIAVLFLLLVVITCCSFPPLCYSSNLASLETFVAMSHGSGVGDRRQCSCGWGKH